MLIINKDTYEIRKKKLGLTAKEIAFQAAVTQTTVGRIKKDAKLQVHSVKQIAKVLSVTVDQLTSPPEADPTNQTHLDMFDKDYLTAASIVYDVSENWIIKHAALFFTLLAEKSLIEREDRAKKLLTEFDQLKEKYQEIQLRASPTFVDYENDYLEPIYEELEAIENKDISGPRGEANAKNAQFINFLAEQPNSYDLDIYDAYEFDKSEQKNVERGFGIEDLEYSLDIKWIAEGILLADDGPEWSVDRHYAKELISDNYWLHELPIKLRTPERANDIVQWVKQKVKSTCEKALPIDPNKKINEKRAKAKQLIIKNAFNPSTNARTLFGYLMDASDPDLTANEIIKNFKEEDPNA